MNGSFSLIETFVENVGIQVSVDSTQDVGLKRPFTRDSALAATIESTKLKLRMMYYSVNDTGILGQKI